MQDHNESGIDYFILQGISDMAELQIPLFVVFLLIYLLTLCGNLLIFTVICLDHHLHKPMYFFLGNLAFLDLFYASVIQPKFLSILLMQSHMISFTGCFVQLYLYISLVTAEFIFLTIMGYDRYVAICKPLQYSVLMSHRICVLLATICWVAGFLEPVSHAIVMTHHPYCKIHISHFYCDYSAILRLSCVDTFRIELMTYVVIIVQEFPLFLLTVASYAYIISTVMNMHSSEGRRKTFSTCAPHLTVVALYYSTILIVHLKPSGKNTSMEEKVIAVMYTILIPLANPFIFTLRNKEVKKSFHRILKNTNLLRIFMY